MSLSSYVAVEGRAWAKTLRGESLTESESVAHEIVGHLVWVRGDAESAVDAALRRVGVDPEALLSDDRDEVIEAVMHDKHGFDYASEVVGESLELAADEAVSVYRARGTDDDDADTDGDAVP